MDHTSDPQAARHVIDPSRIDLAEEYRRNIRGPHSEELAKLLFRTRWGPIAGRYVLVVVEQGRRWMLARQPAERGAPVEIFRDRTFTSLEEAEWHVFKLRWRALTGQDLPLE